MYHIDSEFILAVKANNLNAVTRLLKSGANVHTNGDHALQFSAENGYLDMVTKLLKHGANLHLGYDYALRWSARNGHASVVEKLLTSGANINAGADIKSALMYGAQYNRLDVVTKLLEFNVDVNAKDDHALRLSIYYNHYEMTAKLLEGGANVHCDNKQILKTLRQQFDEELADLLLPYCDADDHEYFPEAYIRKRIIPTKNANRCTQSGNDAILQ